MTVVLTIAASLQKIPDSLHNSKRYYNNFLIELTGDWRVSCKDLTSAWSWTLWRRSRRGELLPACRVMSLLAPELWSVCIYKWMSPPCTSASSHLDRLEGDWSCRAQLEPRKYVSAPRFQISVKKICYKLLQINFML